MQMLEIESFGPINQLCFEIKDFNILVGPQAQGKSTIARLTHFFLTLKEDFKHFYIDYWNQRAAGKSDYPLNFNHISDIRNYFDNSFFNDQTEITFTYTKDLKLKLTKTSNGIQLHWDKRVFELGATIKKEMSVLLDQPKASALRAHIDLQIIAIVSKYVDDFFGFSQISIYIPAARSIVTAIPEQLMASPDLELDFLTQQYLKVVGRTRNKFRYYDDIIHELSKNTAEITELSEEQLRAFISSILKGTYFLDKENREFIQLANDIAVPLKFASSGQQEALWMIYLLFDLLTLSQGTILIIEEPEAHLYPDGQMEIVNLIALFSNGSNNKSLITTHSPYIIHSLNNHIYAGNLAKTQDPEAVNKVVPAKFQLPVSRVSSGFVDQGTLREIIHEELQHINPDAIDDVLDRIDDLFHQILALDPCDEVGI
jgi:AAA15 family ATPase/GTPase